MRIVQESFIRSGKQQEKQNSPNLKTTFSLLLYTLGLQRPKKWLVRGLVKFVTAVARLVCPDLLG